MSGICGWVGAAGDAAQARAALESMRAALHDREASAPEPLEVGGCALAVTPGVHAVSLGRSDGLLAAVEGQVRWRSADLASLAAAQGAAAAVAEAYRRKGEQCLQEIAGPFAVVVIDSRSGEALLAIDRLGTRTMCFARTRDRFVFASNAASVVAHPDVDRGLDQQAIFDYLYCHVIPSPRTIYSAVQKLEPGHCVVFRGARVESRLYWQLPYRDDESASAAALEARFRDLLEQAARNAIDGEAAVGSFLSGGTDSSTVAVMLTRIRGEPARTYSIGFAWEGFDEMGYARITARHINARAREYYVTPQDIADAIPIIARAYDEPFGNDSAAPTYFCAKMAREDGIKVLLAGDGGDEIFGG
ncbi:MAG TPA: asparagine synthase-related protein, partial [Casimicrobiaceae bacterium]|nr:asparagine synthase-related protein [Casimicrobiaceae bacterium]